MITTLTPAQREVLLALSTRVGQTVEVLTSQYDANVDTGFRARAVSLGTVTASTLKGLERKGYIKIAATFWKGARLTVLKPLTQEA